MIRRKLVKESIVSEKIKKYFDFDIIINEIIESTYPIYQSGYKGTQEELLKEIKSEIIKMVNNIDYYEIFAESKK